MTDRPKTSVEATSPRLGAAERTLIRAAAIDLMLHIARTLPPQERRPRKRSEPGSGQA